MNNTVKAYAEAAFAIASAEGNLSEVEDELFRFGRILQSNDELRETLGNQRLPVERRQQIVEDLLDGKTTRSTMAIISLLVNVGRVADIPKIVDELVGRSARITGTQVAEVRSAVALSDDQIAKLTEALKARTNSDVTVRNIVDPKVMGGIVTQIGDSVLDGSVRTRLNQLRDAF
ncbi:MAG: ATP synthase F1 subunit delta [Microthrixaceae bacterium]|nr:ATP synthase F1 subunit delta [Microthrixaceae bacterium]